LCDDSPSSLVPYNGKSGLDDEKPRKEYDFSDGCQNSYSFELECHECGTKIDLTVGCGKRFPQQCPICSKKWKRKTFKKYYRAITQFKDPKFLTLTLRYDKTKIEFVAKDRDIWSMRKELFRVLREQYHKPIKGWVATVEYPNHIHLVIDSPYIDQDLISRTWQTITGDSFKVDIRQVKKYEFRKMASYLTKYISKATCWDDVDLDQLKGFHIKGQWGLNPGVPPPNLCHYGQVHKVEHETSYSSHANADRLRLFLKDSLPPLG